MNWVQARRIARKHKLKARGVVNPVYTVYEAGRARLPLAIAVSLLFQESGGGKNVFGHDPVKSPQIVGGPVTKDRYIRYRTMRRRGLGMQGVGPVQLTWWEFQDLADKYGGCWKPRYNMRVGFEHLANNIQRYGRYEGIKRYNGSGDAAERYAKTMTGRITQWESRFKRD